ncbi:uncharacterized protein LOC114536127 [Dendronephthya gigantea]|uniref:uncharacterized protein LOC114536127 n=1 Tax=Dendronephthya gigantea TaxID=151771 RepID=UPI00106B1665|nr:uncharacterized protein LOC114536127 [Dendronephthya gigantea]
MKLIQDMAVEKGNDGQDLLEKLNTCLMERLTKDDENVMKWLNPLTTLPVYQQYGPAIGIKSSVLDTFINIKSKDVSAFLKSMSDKTSSTSMMFAVQDDCTITDIKKRNEEKCKMAKGWKIPIAAIKPEALHIINDKFNLEWPIHESIHSGISRRNGSVPSVQWLQSSIGTDFFAL